MLSGSVELVDPEARPGACSARSFVQVLLRRERVQDNLWSGWTDADGTFAAPVGRLAHETGYYAFADPYLDPGADCQTADDIQVFRDRDSDSFGDDVDACPDDRGRPWVRPATPRRSGAAGWSTREVIGGLRRPGRLRPT